MKTIYRLFVAMGFILTIPSLQTFSQVRINTDGSSPDPSAMLDVKSTTKGIVLPRMTASQRMAISSAAIGLLVYQTDAPAGFYYYTGTGWMYIGKGDGGGGHMIDEDGIAYPTVKIGNQEWMAENLRVTHYRNGDLIPNEIDELLWSNLTTGAYCWFNNDPMYEAYGGLYNQYAVTDSRNLCPAGWHVPRDAEWANLTNYLGGETVAGGKMKTTAIDWTSPNTGATNISGFSAFPYGYRGSDGLFYGFYFYGNWWTATTYQTNSALYRYLSQNDATALHNYYNMSGGFSVRCMKDSDPVMELPTVITNSATNISLYSAISGGSVISDGGTPVTARGVCWSTLPNPTITNNFTTDGNGTGTFVSSLTGLTPLTLYYVRAYATNSVGTAYGNQESFTSLWSCGSSITIYHVAGVVAPVNKTVTYGTVTNIPGEAAKCWITSNLGADHQATAVNDATEASAGWYWQFNRKQGYQYTTTITPSSGWSNISENSDWTIANDPCNIELGNTWRIPTKTEWDNVENTGAWTNWTGPWNSGLKLHAAGYLAFSGNWLYFRGQWGIYWSNTQFDNTSAWRLAFDNSVCNVQASTLKLTGQPLRCIQAISSWTCGTPITINHVAGALAPVTKTVTYGTVTNIPGEPSKCWITSNLGADHQATVVNDATEASSGWYWQFNRKQGYKHDGTTRTPNSSWITSINENLEWQASNDPCTLELGSDWRIPTVLEWSNIKNNGINPWNSGLKLHYSGFLSNTDGSLWDRGTFGLFWSPSMWFYNTQEASGNLFTGSSLGEGPFSKAFGFTLRCVRN